jgi:hypothetical protein
LFSHKISWLKVYPKKKLTQSRSGAKPPGKLLKSRGGGAASSQIKPCKII